MTSRSSWRECSATFTLRMHGDALATTSTSSAWLHRPRLDDEHVHDDDEHVHDDDEHVHDDDEHVHDDDEHVHDDDDHNVHAPLDVAEELFDYAVVDEEIVDEEVPDDDLEELTIATGASSSICSLSCAEQMTSRRKIPYMTTSTSHQRRGQRRPSRRRRAPSRSPVRTLAVRRRSGRACISGSTSSCTRRAPSSVTCALGGFTFEKTMEGSSFMVLYLTSKTKLPMKTPGPLQLRQVLLGALETAASQAHAYRRARVRGTVTLN